MPLARPLHRALVPAVALLLAGGACTPEPDETPPPPAPAPSPLPEPEEEAFDPQRVDLGFEEVATGLEAPLYLTYANDLSGLRYIVEQTGRIKVLTEDGAVAPEPFLDIADRVTAGGEQGLLGLAFHPEDPDRLFVNYTDTGGNTVVAEYMRESPTRARRGSERTLLRIEQPYANHNGGMLAFGPDGYLYISSGDGGSSGDPHDAGQRTDTLLGKILRIDVDRGDPYAIPRDNPFAGGEGRPEIWAYGLRNPWRFSFDRDTGDLYIADVGQHTLEEVNVQPAGSGGGENYGWAILEGRECFREPGCDTSGLVMPVTQYPTDRGCAVTGGYVYRGDRHPVLRGGYLFADYCGGQVWALSAREALAGRAQHSRLAGTPFTISSFGEDENGDLYLIDHQGGTVQRIVATER